MGEEQLKDLQRGQKVKSPKQQLDRLKRQSIQVFREESHSPLLLQLVTASDECPAWWSARRDQYLRDFFSTEPVLAGAIYSVAVRNAAFRWELSGPPKMVSRFQDMLAMSDMGNGWTTFITKITEDLLTQDNGAFIEVIRPARARVRGKMWDAYKTVDNSGRTYWMAEHPRTGERVAQYQEGFKLTDSPLDLPIGIAHMDAGRCERTGDPEIPIIYTDIDGVRHTLKWWQVLTLEDMPSGRKDMNGVGYCAVTRAFRAAQILRDVSIYEQEKVSGRFNRAVHMVNVDPDSIQDAIYQAEENADNRGLLRYMQPIIAAVLDPSTVPSVATINLASLPDAFDKDSSLRWYVAILALALGVDYGFLAPLPGQGLGTASQSETQARHARGKSSQQFMKMVEFKFNFGGILPQTVEFKFKEVDREEEIQQVSLQQQRAQTRLIRIQSGEITPEVARQIAKDEGDLSEEYMEMLETTDATPGETVEDSEVQSGRPPKEEGADVGVEAPMPRLPQVKPPMQSMAEVKAVTEAGKVEAEGKPLPRYRGKEVDITPEDITRALTNWDRRVPKEARGLLTARTATPEEELEILKELEGSLGVEEDSEETKNG